MSGNLELRVVGGRTIHGAGWERTVEFTLSRVPGMRAIKARGGRAQDTEDQRAAVAYSIRGILAAVLAFITCPCHLPITLPLLLSITTGTAFGAWLVDHHFVFGLASTALFLAGTWLVLRWLGMAKPATAVARVSAPRVALEPRPPEVWEDGRISQSQG